MATGGTQFQSIEQYVIDELVASGLSEDAARQFYDMYTKVYGQGEKNS